MGGATYKHPHTHVCKRIVINTSTVYCAIQHSPSLPLSLSFSHPLTQSLTGLLIQMMGGHATFSLSLSLTHLPK